ncbi:Uncharacterised protein [Bordetella trematum]|nr:Uncharacterised protein [Bordetella trematum]VDH07600.1 Uncharacterised protein [Bordetella trematum]
MTRFGPRCLLDQWPEREDRPYDLIVDGRDYREHCLVSCFEIIRQILEMGVVGVVIKRECADGDRVFKQCLKFHQEGGKLGIKRIDGLLVCRLQNVVGGFVMGLQIHRRPNFSVEILVRRIDTGVGDLHPCVETHCEQLSAEGVFLSRLLCGPAGYVERCSGGRDCRDGCCPSIGSRIGQKPSSINAKNPGEERGVEQDQPPRNPGRPLDVPLFRRFPAIRVHKRHPSRHVWFSGQNVTEALSVAQPRL